MGKFDRGQVIPVQAAQRSVQAHIQPGGQRVFDAVQRVIVAVHAHQLIVDIGVGGVEGNLHGVETGFVEFLAHHAGQHTAVGVQPGDEPLRSLHQLDQIMAQRRLAAGKGQLRDARVAAFFNHGQPLVCVQLRHGGKRLVCGVAVQAFLVAVPRAVLDHRADHQIHAVGGHHAGRVLGQAHGLHGQRRLAAPGNRTQAVHQQLQIALDLRILGLAVNFAGGRHSLGVDGRPFFRTYFFAGAGL